MRVARCEACFYSTEKPEIERFKFIDVHRFQFRVAKLCKVLKVSRSGFYAWLKRHKSKRQIENEKLFEKVKEIFEKKRRIYGYPGITRFLPEEIKASEGRVYRLMRANGLRSKTAKKFKPQTTDSNHSLPVAENILNRDFAANKHLQH